MTQYRLHYAGCTFDLADQTEAENLITEIERIQGLDAGKRLEVLLTNGRSVQIFINRYVAIAVSAEPERTSAYEREGLAV